MSKDLSGLSVFIIAGARSYTMEDLNAYKVTVTDSEEGDSTIEIYCNDEDYRVTDSLVFQVGETIGVRWGYTLNNEVSEERKGYVIVKPSTTYGEDGTLAVIKASTTSLLMSARRPQKSYGKISLKSLINDIAIRNKLQVEITGGDEVVDGFSQGKWSDREAVRVLADRYGYIATYTDTTLKFAMRDFDQKPTLVFYYKRGELSSIISAQVQQNHVKDTGAGESVTKVSFDPDTMSCHKVVVKEFMHVDLARSNPSAHVTKMSVVPHVTKMSVVPIRMVGGFAIPAQDFQQSQQETGTPGGVTGFMAGIGAKVMSLGGGTNKLWDATDVQDLSSLPPTMDNVAKSHAIAGAMNAKTRKADMTMTVEGEPRLSARQVIDIVGLSKRDSGKWWTLKVTHNLDLSSGYTCDIELARSGHNLTGSGSANTKVNNQNGGMVNCHSKSAVVKADLDTRVVTRTPK